MASPFLDRMLHHTAHLVCRHTRITLITATLITLICAPFVYRLFTHLETDLAALLPDGYHSVHAFDQIKRRLAGLDNLTILLDCSDEKAMQSFADVLTQEFKQEAYKPYIHLVDTGRDIAFFKQRALLYMNQADLQEILDRIEDHIAHEKLKLSPLYIAIDNNDEDPLDFSDIEKKYQTGDQTESAYVNSEHTLQAIRLVASGASSDLKFARHMLAVVQQAVQKLDPTQYHPDLKVAYGGTVKNRLDEFEVIRHDITSTLAYGAAGVVLMLILYFRQPLAAVFVAGPLVMGLIWAFGLTYAIIGNLNTFTGFLFAVLFGLGIDFGIHLFARYLEDRQSGASPIEAAVAMLVQTGRAMFTSGLTTTAAFYALTITDFRGFSEFGFIVGTGMITAMLAMITVLPAALVFFDQELNWLRPRKVWGHTEQRTKGRFPQARIILFTCVLATVFFGLRTSQLQFEYDFTNLRANLPTSLAVKQKLDTLIGFNGLSQSPAVVLAETKDELDAIVSAYETRIASPDSTPTIQAVKTLWSFLPDKQSEKLKIISRLKELANGEGAKLIKGDQKKQLDDLRPLLDVAPTTIEDLPENIRLKFSDDHGNPVLLAFVYPSVQLRDGRNAMAFADDAGTITASKKTFYASSANIVFADMLKVMLRDSRIAIVLTVTVVFVIVLIDFKNLKRTCLVLLPLTVGLIWTCGLMVVLGLKLNFYNMIALPCIIGMGIDNGVHLYHRYCEEGPGSLPLVLRRTGGAMLMCLLTTMVGFAGLLTAVHPGLNAIGVLSLLGLCACFLAAITFLPALLQVFEKQQ